MVPVIFDLDGTLADTKPLVVRAYAAAGIDMPDEAWGKPARDWLPVICGDEWEVVHRTKNIAYRALLDSEGVEPLPAAHLARHIGDFARNIPQILTGASSRAAWQILKKIDLAHLPLLGSEKTIAQKIYLLNELSPSGVYFDDDEAAAQAVIAATNWGVVMVGPSATIEDLVGALRETEDYARRHLGGR